MKILFDTNVVLDVLLERQPFYEKSLSVFKYVEDTKISGYVCATTITTIHYFVQRSLGREKARVVIRNLLTLFTTAPVTHSTLTTVAYANIDDFEDSVISEAAICANVNAIVTRNERDFINAAIPVYTPTALIPLLKNQ